MKQRISLSTPALPLTHGSSPALQNINSSLVPRVHCVFFFFSFSLLLISMRVRHGQATRAPSQQQQKTLTRNQLTEPVRYCRWEHSRNWNNILRENNHRGHRRRREESCLKAEPTKQSVSCPCSITKSQLGKPWPERFHNTQMLIRHLSNHLSGLTPEPRDFSVKDTLTETDTTTLHWLILWKSQFVLSMKKWSLYSETCDVTALQLLRSFIAPYRPFAVVKTCSALIGQSRLGFSWGLRFLTEDE